MTAWLAAAFLVAHGLLHVPVYVAPRDPAQRVPYDPAHSWALAALRVDVGLMHTAGSALSVLVAVLYTCAGLGVVLDLVAWSGLAALAAVAAIVLKGLWFNVWLSLGVALDAAVLAAVAAGWPASLY